MNDELRRDLEALHALTLDVADEASIEAAFTEHWGFGRSEDDGSMEQSCWDDGLKAFTAGVLYERKRGLLDKQPAHPTESDSMPTPAPGQCPMCGEYSMSARAHQGLYGVKVDL